MSAIDPYREERIRREESDPVDAQTLAYGGIVLGAIVICALIIAIAVLW